MNSNMILSMRLPEKLSERLEVFAKTHDRSKSYIVKKALESYLDEYLPHIPNARTAKVLRDAMTGQGMDKKTYSSSKEMLEDLGL